MKAKGSCFVPYPDSVFVFQAVVLFLKLLSLNTCLKGVMNKNRVKLSLWGVIHTMPVGGLALEATLGQLTSGGIFP